MCVNDSDLRETWRVSYCREHDNTPVNGLLWVVTFGEVHMIIGSAW